MPPLREQDPGHIAKPLLQIQNLVLAEARPETVEKVPSGVPGVHKIKAALGS